MVALNEFEKRILEHFKKQILASTYENTNETIYGLIIEYIYGKGARDPGLTVNWNKVYAENQCPACSGTITLQEDKYVCKNCSFTIPLNLYDQAAKEHDNRKNMLAEDKRFMDEIRNAGIRPKVLDGIYEMAMNEAMNEVDEREKQKKERTDGVSLTKRSVNINEK